MTIDMEWLANEFALALLMPVQEYKKQLSLHTDEHGIVNTKAIAEYFHVTISDAHMRGVSLGLLRNF